VKTAYLVSNSPGEVSTFVRPVLTELRRNHPDWAVQLCLVPCPYATGAEAEVADSWPDPPQVWTPWETTKAWWSGSQKGKSGVVVFLGGDPWHALLLKRSFHMPVSAYFPEHSSWEETRWLGGFDQILRGYGDLGDLRVDAVRHAVSHYPQKEGAPLTLGLFPGSRRLHLMSSLGPFLRVLEGVKKHLPAVKLLLAASPFVGRTELAKAAAQPLNFGLALSRAHLEGERLVTENGTEIEVVWGKPYEVMARCDLALSLPGTNTAELAIAGKPTVVPLSYRVPVGGGGILGLLDRLPGLGFLKYLLRERKRKKLTFVALPNQLAGRQVIPEFFVRDDLTDLVDFVANLLGDEERRTAMGREAQAVMGEPGAARRVVEQFTALV